jgi:hypothetical protein
MGALVDEVRKRNQDERKTLKKGMHVGGKEGRINVPQAEYSDAYEGDNSQCHRDRPVRSVKTRVHKNNLSGFTCGEDLHLEGLLRLPGFRLRFAYNGAMALGTYRVYLRFRRTVSGSWYCEFLPD